MKRKINIRDISSSTLENIAAYHDDRIAIIDNLRGNYLPQNFSPVKMEIFIAVLCLRGQVTFFIDNKKYTASENDLLLCQPQNILEHSNMDDDFECLGFCLSPEYMKQILWLSPEKWNTRFFIENHPVISLNNESCKIFRQYYDLFRSKLLGTPHRHQKELINALLLAFVYEMHDSLEVAMLSEQVHLNYYRAASSLFTSFIDLVNESYPKPRSVAYYADKLCVTPKYLSLVCKAYSGETALGIITQYVVKDIVFLLRQPEKSIKDIANELNFPNLSFFGKYVKRNLGKSPKEYRSKI